MEPAVYNYEHFRQPGKALIDAEVTRLNEGYETHPEVGALFASAPCDNCFEILPRRTETTKTFSERGTNGRHVWVQSSTDPMHYRDAQGQWQTIQHALAPAAAGLYTSIAAPVPISIDTRAGYAGIGRAGGRILFNRGLELLFIQADGTERSLGIADWTQHRAGDDGVYVREIWPGIDMEITVFRGAAKTNFIINAPMPAYAAGQLAIRDQLKAEGALRVSRPGEKPWNGPLEIKHVSGQTAYIIHPAVAYEKNNAASSVRSLDYRMSGNGDELDILIAGGWLNRPAAAYPVVIDPLVQSTNAVVVPGSTYSPLFTVGCATLNPAPVPAQVQVSDVRWTFDYQAVNGAVLSQGAVDFNVGSCRSPSQNGFYWFCNNPQPGTCVGQNISIFTHIQSCIPQPQCTQYNLNVTLNLYRAAGNNGIPCSNNFIIAGTPYTIVVEGYTVERDSISVAAPNATICEGDSTQLLAVGQYGVPPYTYGWSPGGGTGSSVTVSPTVTTTYVVTVTDGCGNTDLDTTVVYVRPNDNPGFTITPEAACIGVPITVTGQGMASDTQYAWIAPGSADPAVSGTKTWTTTYGAAGTYDITLNYESDFCMFPLTRQVTIYPSVFHELTDSICEGDQYPFNAALLTTAGTYTDTFATATGCDSVVILHLKVHPIPPPPVVSSNSPLCQYDELRLEASVLQQQATYEWTGPGGYRDTGRTPVRSRMPVSASGVYSATVTVKTCTSPPGSTEVLVRPVPEIAIQADKTDICAGDTVRFETIYSPAYRYQWTPADFMLANDNAVVRGVVGYKGYIDLKVTDTVQCVHTDSIYINTHPCCGVYLPNAFTPNGDGKNDVFRIITDGYQRLSVFRIVNRWGETVFATADQRNGWDGTHKGQPQGAGTYHYYLKYSCADGGIYETKGELVLMR